MTKRQSTGDLRGWDVITADGERVGTVAAVHGSDSDGSTGGEGMIEVALTVPGRSPEAPATEELRAAERGRDASHLRATDQRPPGTDLLGDVSPVRGAHHGSPEETIRPRGTEETARERIGSGTVLLPLGAVHLDRDGRRVMAVQHTSAELAALPSPAASSRR